MPITGFPAGTLGAAFAPEEWAAYVLDHLSAASVVLASGATEVRTSAKAVHVPRFTGDASTNWYAELEEIDEGCPPGNDLELTPRKVATLCRLSNEVISDSNANVLDAVGSKMVRSVALAADRAILAGAPPKGPAGILTIAGLPSFGGAPDYAGLVNGAGMIRAAGGEPNVAYVNPVDVTELQLATDANDRPLISGDPTQGAPSVIAGLAIWPTPAVPAGTALVADASQIIVAVREDASVAVSDQAAFTSDGTIARVIARVDAGVNDPAGLALVKAGGTAAQASKSTK